MAERPQPNINEPEVSDVGQPSTDDGAAQTLQGLGDFMGNLRDFARQQETEYAKDAAREEGIEEGTEAAEQGEAPDLPQGQSVVAQQQRQASIDSWQAQTKTEAQQAISDIYEQHKAEPDMLNQKVEAYRKGVEQKLPDQMIPDFRQSIERWRRTYHQKSKARFEKKQRAENREVAKTFHRNKLKAIRDIAENNPAVAIEDGRLQGEVADWASVIAKHGPPGEFEFAGQTFEGGNGTFDLNELNEMYDELQYKTQREVALAKFKDLKTLEDKKAFRDNFKADADKPKGEQTVELGPEMTLSDENREKIRKAMDKRLSSLRSDRDLRLGKIKDDLRRTRDFLLDENGTISPQRKDEVKRKLNILQKHDETSAYILGKDLETALSTQDYYLRMRKEKPARVYNELQRLKDLRDSDNPKDVNRLPEKIERLRKINQQNRTQEPMKVMNAHQKANFPRVNFEDILVDEEKRDQVLNTLRERKSHIPKMAQDYGVSPSKAAWHGEELSQLKSRLNNPSTTSDEKIELGKFVREAFGNHAQSALKPLAKSNPVFAHAVGLETNNPDKKDVARDIIKGQELIANTENVFLPSERKLFNEANEIYGESFKNLQHTKDNAIKAAKAYYANNVPKGEQLSSSEEVNFDEKLWREALQKVTGAHMNPRTNKWEGGVTSIRGKDVILPDNVSKKKFKFAINNLDSEELGTGEQVLQEISVGGGKPRLMGINGKPDKELTVDMLQNNPQIKFENSGNGKYFLKIGEKYAKGTGKNGLYEMDMNFLKEVSLPGTIEAQGVDRDVNKGEEDREDVDYVPFY